VTAERLERILREGSFSVMMETETYEGLEARCMIALNARRSAQAVARFKSQYPDHKVLILLTGTDINHVEMNDAESPTRQTIEAADALVVLHDADLHSVPTEHLHKTTRIFPSVQLPLGSHHQGNENGSFQVIMAGNLRPVKNPRLAVAAARLLPADKSIKISSYGGASGSLAEDMQYASESLECFHWAGKLNHTDLVRKMEHAHVLLNTSTQEGGANAICEAISLGLPVIASHIRGNIGMLGDDYEGFFPSEDRQALADILHRCSTDSVFYSDLKAQVSSRAHLFAYTTEAKAWTDLVQAQLSS